LPFIYRHRLLRMQGIIATKKCYCKITKYFETVFDIVYCPLVSLYSLRTQTVIVSILDDQSPICWLMVCLEYGFIWLLWSHYLIITAGKNIWEEGKDSDDNIQYDRRKVPQQVSLVTSHYYLVEYCIQQNFQVGKLSWLCTKYTIHWKTFAVHQAVAIMYCTQQVIQGENFHDRLKNWKDRESFPTWKFCRIRYDMT